MAGIYYTPEQAALDKQAMQAQKLRSIVGKDDERIAGDYIRMPEALKQENARMDYTRPR